MSASPDEPEHFLKWLCTRSEFEPVPEIELRERFAPRQIYGDYLRSIVQHHLQSPPETWRVSSEFVVGDAIDIEPRDGRCLVSLAETLAAHPAWVTNAWQRWEDRLPAHDGIVAILGTGLTAVDAIITLRDLGWLGSIHANSRHGWFPHAHFRGIEYPEFPPEGVDLATLTLDELQLLVEEHCTILHEQNANPAIIVDKLRPHNQRIWRNFSRDELWPLRPGTPPDRYCCRTFSAGVRSLRTTPTWVYGWFATTRWTGHGARGRTGGRSAPARVHDLRARQPVNPSSTALSKVSSSSTTFLPAPSSREAATDAR